MDFSEVLVFIVSIFVSVMFLSRWVTLIYSNWPPERNQSARKMFASLPLISLVIILVTLLGLASFDVVGDAFWTFFYIVFGYAWIHMGLTAMSAFFDLSWIDDVLNLSNNAATVAIAGGFLGITVIYSGANIGDGPGWWCVLFAGGLGMAAWIVFGFIINLFTKVFETVTVGRDICCGIRTGCYFLASGIILGRASAGDWTSFYMTVIEFLVGWPILILAALMIAVELYFL